MDRIDLVGREAEVHVLLRSLDEVMAGQPTATVVSGDAGMGKTSLLTVLKDEAERRGGRVLTGRASEFEALPLGVIVHALDDHLRTLRPEALDAVDASDRSELASIFPSLQQASQDSGVIGSPDERVRGYMAVRSLLEVLAVESPLVLVLDDLHWADRSSVELFAFLMRRPPQARVLLVGSYRPYQVDAALSAEVARGTNDGWVRCVELSPLSVTDAATLIDVEDPVRVRRLHAAAGGNPFFLLELTRTGLTGSGGELLPPTIARAIVGDLKRISPDQRRFIDAGSVVGDPFELDLVASVSEFSDEEGYAAVDALVAWGLIRPTEVPRHFEFRHPLVRQAVYEGLPPGQRLLLHERCLEVLADRGVAASTLAHHVEHAARTGDRLAVDLLMTAGKESAARAPDNAVRWLRTARRLLPETATRAEQLDLITPLPSLLMALGQADDAHSATLEALDLTDDDHQRVSLSLRCAAVEQSLGQYDAAHQRLLSMLESLPSPHGTDAASVMIAMVMDGFYRRDSEAVMSWTRRAVTEAERLGQPVLAAAARAGCALCHALAGEVDEAVDHLDAAVALLPQLSDEDLAARLDVLGGIAGAELYLDRYEACAHHCARGLEIGRSTGDLLAAPTLVPSYGTSLWVLGRLQESLSLLDAAVESARAARQQQGVAWTLLNLALAQVMAGDVETALANGREGLGVAERHDDSVLATWAGATVALAEMESGRPEAALATLMRAGGGAELTNIPGGWRTHFLELATRCHLALGDIDAAAASAVRADEWSQAVGLPYARSMALRASAACALARGDSPAAVELALAAAAEADSVSARIDAARARTLAGRALAAAGRTTEAIDALTEAAAFLDSSGSPRFRDHAELELGRLGQRPHRRTTPGTSASGVGALTAREREIAALVVSRHTNPEIAATMYLSPKTVESHLRNIFRKLGVSSRIDVARAMEAASVAEA